MKTIHFFTLVLLLLASPYLRAQPGTIDATFNPTDLGFNNGLGASGSVLALALQPDGKILIGGGFTSYNGTPRNMIARLNTDGSLDTDFNPGMGANDEVNNISLQPDGKILIGGNFVSYNGTPRLRIARLNADGSLDMGFNPGMSANDWVYAISLQPDGKILIGGGFTSYNGTPRNRVARLNVNGSLDVGFNPGTGANDWVNAIALQPDGKILVGGGFTSYNGTPRNRVARLNVNGSLDTGFNPGTGASSTVNAMALQPDGKILIGGWFEIFNGTTRNRIARLNADGSLDTGFNPSTGADRSIRAMALQPDGKILIGGQFTSYNGTPRNRVARLNANGSLDTGFNPGTGASSTVFAMALQPDGKILIGGWFTTYNDTSRNYIACLNADGSLDSGFNPGMGADRPIRAIALQPDGKILIGGGFTSYNGTPRRGIARLNADGSIDMDFSPGTGASGTVYAIVLQPDGKILIGGNFLSYNDTPRKRIARLNADGSLDMGFNPGTWANDDVQAIAIQPDGKILIGGRFTSYNGTPPNYIARLNADGSLDTGFNSGTGANLDVSAIAVRPDGKIIIGGRFFHYNGTAYKGIARLNSDGSLDTGFNPGTGVNLWVHAIALQPDEKILIGGYFSSFNSIPRNRIARLNADGSLDTGFNPGTGADEDVNAIALQPDGKILIVGNFTNYNGTGRNFIARLNADGSLDAGFDPGTGANGSVGAMTLQPDGKALIGGWFWSYNGTGRNHIARVNAYLAGNECPDANLINTIFQGMPNVPQISRLWDNTHYMAFASDPALDCWNENVGAGTEDVIDASLWYRFSGTGMTYRIQTVPCNATNYIGTAQDDPGDTQMAIYSGNNCNNLSLVACNDNLYPDGTPDFRAGLELPTEAGRQYFMLLDGFNAQGVVARGEFCIEVTQLDPNSVTEIDKTGIHIFPNPTTGHIQLAHVQADRVEVYDNTGRMLLHLAQPVSALDISGLPAGMYFLKVTVGGSVHSARVVKQ